MKSIILVLIATLALAACKPAGTNDCKNGDVSCDQTKGN